MPCGLPLERKSYATEAGPVAVCVLSFLSVVRTSSLSRCDVACLGMVAAPFHSIQEAHIGLAILVSF